MTIPRMVENRYETVTTLFSGNVLVNSLNNFKDSVLMLIKQNDKLPWNAIESYGIIYLFSVPFTVIGIISEFKKKEKYSEIIKVWSIVAFIMLFICEANINRCNIIMIPIIYYTIMGISEVIKEVKFIKIVILSIYILFFIAFEMTYYLIDFNEYSTFEANVEEVVEYVEELEDVDKIYFPYNIKEPYIYVLFYSQTEPQTYIDTVQKKNENGTFENIRAFGKYEFYLPNEFENDGKSVYVIPLYNELEINYDEWKTTYFERFIVLESEK